MVGVRFWLFDRCLVGVSVLVVVVVLFSACGGEGGAEPEAVSTPVLPAVTTITTSAGTVPPVTTTTVTVPPVTTTTTAVPPPAATTGPGAPDEASGSRRAVFVDDDTAFGDVLDTLSDAEQGCIRDALGEDTLEMLSGVSLLFVGDPVAAAADDVSGPLALFLSCLRPDTARGLFLTTLIVGWETAAAEAGLSSRVGTDEEECLWERAAGLDAVVMAGAWFDDSIDIHTAALLGCVAGLFTELVIASAGLVPEDVTVEQRECMAGTFAGLADSDDPGAELAGVLFGCLFGVGFDTDPAASLDPEDLAGAVEVPVGEAVPGVLDSEGEVDLFVFESEQGTLYRIEVILGTLTDSVATVYDVDGIALESNDDFGGTAASLISRHARDSGRLYVAVEGYSGETGSYTVSVTEAVDDHASMWEGATPVTLGEATPGDLGHSGDVDFFVFEAKAGVLYKIDAATDSPLTLFDAAVVLHDSGGNELAGNDDRSNHPGTSGSRYYASGNLAPLLYWEARNSGRHYVAVSSGWSDPDGIGTYALTVTAIETDDHGYSLDGATPVTPGQAVSGAVQYTDDVDFFVFTGQADTLYRIDVSGELPAAATLYDVDGVWLERDSWNRGRGLQTRIYWETQNTDIYHVAVENDSFFGGGAYTLLVTVIDPDDHGLSLHNATPLKIGESISGTVDYDDDRDSFAWDGEQDTLYQIDVTIDGGPLYCCVVTLYDPDGNELDSHEDSHEVRIFWEAEHTGLYQIIIENNRLGASPDFTPTYTLTVTVR